MTPAFVSVTPALAAKSSVTVASAFCGARMVPRRAAAAPSPQARRTVRAVMSPGGGGDDDSRAATPPSIDFGNVDMRDAGANLAGLVFTPEDAHADTLVQTRVGMGYTSAQAAAVNAQINVEFTAMYAYHALWAYFDRDTVALPGFAAYFQEMADEERDHAHEFMTYQNQRGGVVQLMPIAVPEMKFTMQDGTSDALYAMDLHLQLEKFVAEKLRQLHKVAEEADDPQMQDFVEQYLTHQVEAIKTAADYVARIKRVGTPHGVYHFDLELRKDKPAA